MAISEQLVRDFLRAVSTENQVQQPAAVWCRICGKGYYSDQAHACELEPVIRAREAQKRRIAVEFRHPPEIHEVVEYLTLVCGRHLAIPPNAEMITGRYHYGVGYVWSWRRGIENHRFSVFAGSLTQ